MNVHHLELFYYVARHGGVSAAARHMPYGIQQPAVSAQIIQLEDNLGTTLFHRRPFSLTKSGTDLYAHLRPFFEGLPEVAAKLRGSETVAIRIGAPETVQRDYMPRLLARLKKRFPRMRFTLSTGQADWMEKALLEQEIDIGLSSLLGKRLPGVHQKELLRVEMSLLVPEKSGYTKAESFWDRDRIDLPLIALPAVEPVCQLFQAELAKRKVEWFPSLEVPNQELVAHYVSRGFGAGLTLAPGPRPAPEGTRRLVLPDFPSIPYGVLWLGNLNAFQEEFVLEAAAEAAAAQEAR
ncbi:MAG: LysR family transcriptional regulator [Verrucomicrobiota bacterium]